MAYKKVGEAATKNGIAELAKRVPPNQALKFKDFQAKHAEYLARVNRQPEKLPNIDFEYYKRNVRSDYVNMVGEFEQKYKGVCEAFDKRHQQDKSNYFVEIDRLKKQVQDEVERYKAASNERIKALEAKYAQIEALIPYEEMTAEEYSELLPEKSFYKYKGEPSFWPHTEDEQGPGPSVKDAHGHGDDGGHGGGEGGHGGSGGGAGGSSGGAGASSDAAVKPQSDAVTQSEQTAKPSQTPPPAPTEPVKASVVKQQSNDFDVPCFESEQFKQDLEYLKKCFEESSTKSVNHSNEKKGAAKNIKPEIINPASIATEIAKAARVKAVPVEKKTLNVFDPNKKITTQLANVLEEGTANSTTQKEAPYVDGVREDVVVKATKTAVSTNSSQSTAIKAEIKLDLPDLAKYLEEVASKTFDAAEQESANAKKDELLLTKKGAERDLPKKTTAIFMPVEPEGLTKPKTGSYEVVSKIAEPTVFARVENLAVNELQVKVIGMTEIIHDAEGPYPSIEKIQVKEIEDATRNSIEIDNTQVPENVATNNINISHVVVSQSEIIATNEVSQAKVEPIQRTQSAPPSFKAAEAVSVKGIHANETTGIAEVCQKLGEPAPSISKASDSILSSIADSSASKDMQTSLKSSSDSAKSTAANNAKAEPVQSITIAAQATLINAVVVEASKDGISTDKPKQVEAIIPKAEPFDVQPKIASSNEKPKAVEKTMPNFGSVPTEPKAAPQIVDQFQNIEPSTNKPPKVVSTNEKTVTKAEPVQAKPKAPTVFAAPATKVNEETKPVENVKIRLIVKYAEPLSGSTSEAVTSKQNQAELISPSETVEKLQKSNPKVDQVQPVIKAVELKSVHLSPDAASKQLQTESVSSIEKSKLTNLKTVKSVTILDEVPPKETKSKDISSNEKNKPTVSKVKTKASNISSKKTKPTRGTSLISEPVQIKPKTVVTAVIDTAINASLQETKAKVSSPTSDTTPTSATNIETKATNSIEKTKPMEPLESNIKAAKPTLVNTTTNEALKDLKEEIVAKPIKDQANQKRYDPIAEKTAVVEKVVGQENKAAQPIVTKVASTAIAAQECTVPKKVESKVIISSETIQQCKISSPKGKVVLTSLEADDSLSTAAVEDTDTVQAILKSAELSSTSTAGSVTAKSVDKKVILTGEVVEPAKALKAKEEPVQAILKATESTSDYAPKSTDKKGSTMKIIDSIELLEQAEATCAQIEPVQAILKTIDSVPSSIKNADTKDLSKKVIISNAVIESAPVTSKKAALVPADSKAVTSIAMSSKELNHAKDLSVEKANSSGITAATEVVTSEINTNIKFQTDQTAAKASKPTSVKTEKGAGENIIKTSEKTEPIVFKTEESTFMSAVVKGLKVRVITSNEIFEQTRGTIRKNKPAQNLITASDKINPAVDVNLEVQSTHSTVKAVESSSNKTLDKVETKDTKSKAAVAAVNAPDKTTSKDLQAKVSNSNVRVEPKTGFKKPNTEPTQSTHKGFTLVGLPETIAVKSSEAEVTRPSELFESIHLKQDYSNADKSSGEAFSKASKKDESTSEESVKSVKAAKAES